MTVAKAYRLLHAIFETAVDDRLVRRNPCRIEGAGKEDSPARAVISVPETPKSRAGRRTVTFPAELVDELSWHLERFAAPGEQGLVFVGPKGRAGRGALSWHYSMRAGEGNRTLMTSLEDRWCPNPPASGNVRTGLPGMRARG